ncbi:unnamed protein product [Prorocentrum cordatum]|uniref:Uncharacterized protein n=1 Tax=Prorocentrum cordatum TaxID=2364126 RepID=A0ABN9SFS1_9DINO|nr:unnamed protein product [Polarella glacialis]
MATQQFDPNDPRLHNYFDFSMMGKAIEIDESDDERPAAASHPAGVWDEAAAPEEEAKEERKLPTPLRVPSAAALLEKAKKQPPVSTKAEEDKANAAVRKRPAAATAPAPAPAEPKGGEESEGTPDPKPRRPTIGHGGRALPNHLEWAERHQDILKLLPSEAQPPPFDHGEKTYTVNLTLGPLNKPARIEVHVKAKAYRVVRPKMVKEEKPLTPWGEDAHAAWEESKTKALTKLDAM